MRRNIDLCGLGECTTDVFRHGKGKNIITFVYDIENLLKLGK